MILLRSGACRAGGCSILVYACPKYISLNIHLFPHDCCVLQVKTFTDKGGSASEAGVAAVLEQVCVKAYGSACNIALLSLRCNLRQHDHPPIPSVGAAGNATVENLPRLLRIYSI